ncbi:MAG: hypothetical protein IH934_05930 [Nanoarchaeota archaeon]|nr:hypothetical protein [Nanoarchaeota archaeon]
MLEDKLYDNRQESFWFLLPQDVKGEVFAKTETTPQGVSYHSRVIHTIQDDRYHAFNYGLKGQTLIRESAQRIDGYVIPSERVKDFDFDGAIEILKESTSISDDELLALSESPSQMIRLMTFSFVTSYGPSLDRIDIYGSSNTPLLALDEQTGACKERASVAAAIAKSNNTPYRIVGSFNLAPDKEMRIDELAEHLSQYNGDLRRTMSKEAQKARYPFWWSGPWLSESQSLGQWTNIPLEEDLYRFFYPHFWIEVEENEQWVPIDTLGWNPISFPLFKDGVEQRFICKEVDMSKLKPK